MPVWTIYKHTNKAIVNGKENGKVYIGQTVKTMMNRWKNGNGYEHNKHFSAAIKKYGKENFSHEVLTFCGTQETADQIEAYFIAKYNSTNKENGYNKIEGGRGNCIKSEEMKISLRRFSPEEEQKIIIEYIKIPISINRFSKIIHFDRKCIKSLLQRNNIHIWTKEEYPNWIRNNPKGRKHSEESKQKIKKSKIGKNYYNKIETDQIKRIIELYTIEKISPTKISSLYNVSIGTIYNVLKKNNIDRDKESHIKYLPNKGSFIKGQKAHNKIEWTDEQMKEILDLSISCYSLSKKYNCSETPFYKIRNKKNK